VSTVSGGCADITDVVFIGSELQDLTVLANPDNELDCPILIDGNPIAGIVPTVSVNYLQTNSMWVESVVPHYGTVEGGDTIIFNIAINEYYGILNATTVSITLDEVACVPLNQTYP
jgi:hypothetical protein